jgi:hypothetical protein
LQVVKVEPLSGVLGLERVVTIGAVSSLNMAFSIGFKITVLGKLTLKKQE